MSRRTEEHLLEALLFLMEETFEGHPQPGNAYLDSGTGWVDTLAGIDAERASQPAVPGGTTIAGHLEHTRYYMAVLREFMTGRTEPVDWAASWLVRDVDAEQWEALKWALTAEARETKEFLRRVDEWNGDTVGGAVGLLAHCAYHLGAVRQMMRVVAD
jgi:hypothetical protein